MALQARSITTDRFLLTLIEPDEIDLMWEIDQDPEVMKYINGGHCTTREEVRTIFVPRLSQYRNPAKGWGLWKITDKASSVVHGWILVRPMNFFSDNPDFDNIELGWRLRRSAWGKGIATEAAKGVMAALEKQTHVRRFSAIADEENHASIRVMEKLGMSYQGKRQYEDPLFSTEVVVYERKIVQG